MGKKSPAPPPAPDYATLAIKQGEANLAAAKQSAYMSNPNIYTPQGSQTVTWTKTPQVDTDAYQKALQAYYDRVAQFGPESGGAEPTQEQFTTFIEQPTVRQTINPNAEAALREQELAQLRMSQAAAGAAGGLQNLGIASAFDARNLPGLQYNVAGGGPITSAIPYQELPGYTDIGYANQGLINAPGAAYTPTGAYYSEALPAQIGAGQQAQANLPVQGAILPFNEEYYGLSRAGPAAPGVMPFQYGGPQTAIGETGFAPAGSAYISIPREYGADYSGVGGVSGGVSGGAFGYAGAGPNAGLFGFAAGGPQGINLQGLDLTGLGGPQAAPAQGQFGYAQQFVGGPQLQGQIDVSQLAAAPVQAGTTAQQAIMSRLAPQLQGERQQLYTQLINQGLRPGGEAFNAAMSAQMQKENDLLLQAAAQGISLDQAARQQGFAEQQARAMFANQAQLQGFGAGMEQAGLYNVGLGQNVQQALATQAAQNQAQQQAFQQRLQAGEFGREAQLASFQTGQQAQEAQNRAIAQNFAQAQAAQEAQNQAISQNFQQALAAQQAQNAALGQGFGQAMGAAEFNRAGLLAQFGMGQQAQELANAAAAQNFQQQVAAQQANLARQAQQSSQAQTAAQFYNQAQAQAMQQELARQQAQNAVQGQTFQQIVQQQEARNAALGQRFNQDMARIAAQNQAAQQQFQQNLAQQQFYNTAAQQALAQQAAIRSLPVNEISALLSGGQVAVPQFQGYSGVSVAPAPIFQAGTAQDAAAMQRYGIQANQAASNMGGLFNLAGSLGSAALLSDRRLKSNIERIGTHPLGIGIYEYDIFGSRQRGVMADEVEAVRPEAVITRDDGYKMVNYGML